MSCACSDHEVRTLFAIASRSVRFSSPSCAGIKSFGSYIPNMITELFRWLLKAAHFSGWWKRDGGQELKCHLHLALRSDQRRGENTRESFLFDISWNFKPLFVVLSRFHPTSLAVHSSESAPWRREKEWKSFGSKPVLLAPTQLCCIIRTHRSKKIVDCARCEEFLWKQAHNDNYYQSVYYEAAQSSHDDDEEQTSHTCYDVLCCFRHENFTVLL